MPRLKIEDLRAEAECEPYVLEAADGREWVIPHLENWPISTAKMMLQGEPEDALIAVMGQEEWDALQAEDLDYGMTRLLIQRIGEGQGLGGTGNGSEPSHSSKSTAKKSKRPSKRTTAST